MNEVWLIVDWPPQPETVLAQGAGTAEELGTRLRESVADVAAGRVEGMVWKVTDDLWEEQVADLIAELPDVVKAMAEKPPDFLGEAAGIPAPVAAFGTDVTVTFLLEPVLDPVEKTIHACEVVGLAVALLTGLHPLAAFCVKHFARDELGSVLAKGFEKLMSLASAQAVDDQSIVGSLSSMAAAIDPGSAAGSGPEALAAVNHEPAAAQPPSLPTMAGAANPETFSTNREGSARLSSDSAKRLRDAMARVDRAKAEAASPGEILRGQTEAVDDLCSTTTPIDAVWGLGSAFG